MKLATLLFVGIAGGALLSLPAWAQEADAAADKHEMTVVGEAKPRPELQVVTGVRAWRVNGEEISVSEVQNRALMTYGPYVLQDLVVEKLLLQEAKRQGVTVSDAEVQAKMTQIREEQGVTADAAFARYLQAQRLTPEAFGAGARDYVYIEKMFGDQVYVSDDEAAASFDQSKGLYQTPETASYRAMEFADQAAAQAALAELRKGGNFTNVAKSLASPDMKAYAGELVIYRRGQNPGLPKEVEDALFAAPLNQVIGPVKVLNRNALIKVERKTDAHQFTYNEIKERIKGDIRRSKLESVVWPGWIAAQLAAADIAPVK
jgi:foldase protein PrsA